MFTGKQCSEVERSMDRNGTVDNFPLICSPWFVAPHGHVHKKVLDFGLLEVTCSGWLAGWLTDWLTPCMLTSREYIMRRTTHTRACTHMHRDAEQHSRKVIHPRTVRAPRNENNP